MTDRIQLELELIRTCFPHVGYREKGRWVRIPRYDIRAGVWDVDHVEVCFRIPGEYPGRSPYGFYVRPDLRIPGTGALPENYTSPAHTPFGPRWGMFSWWFDEWAPTADPTTGSSLLNFVRSFAQRLHDRR